MRSTDFVDGDLTQDDRTDSAPARQGGTTQGHEKLARHRDDVSENVVGAIDEIERLRRRQHELEQEKRDLEELGRKQEDYERGKREMIQHLNEGIVTLEKKEVQSAQLTELLAATRNRFKETLAELETIDENKWADDHFREELYKALVIVDDARMEYNKAFAKIEVLDTIKEPMTVEQATGIKAGMPQSISDRDFTHWLKVGFAVSLPLVIMLALLAAILAVVRHLLPPL